MAEVGTLQVHMLEILQEKLCNNTLIQVGGMPLEKEFDFLTKNGMLHLSDLVDNNVLLTREHLNENVTFQSCPTTH